MHIPRIGLRVVAPASPLPRRVQRLGASSRVAREATGRQKEFCALPSAKSLWVRPPGTALQAPTEVFLMRSRLRQRLQWWESIGACRRVLSTIKSGVLLDFMSKPRPFTRREIPVQPEHREWLHAELDRAVQAGAYEAPTCLDFVAPAFIHVQRGGKKRIVIDFGNINDHCRKGSCRYEGLKDLRYLLRPGDWMFSLDLTDAYWHVPIHQAHRKFLTFSVDGRILQCAVLPFGWTGSPLTFTKIMRAFVRHLRSQGIRCLPYLDDLAFFVSGSYQDALAARQIVEDALLRSGLTRKPSKGHWEPTQRLPDHLGITVDSIAGTFSAPARRCTAVSSLAKDLLCRAARAGRRVPSDLLRRFAGTGVSLTLALRSARFRMRAVFDCLSQASTSTLSRQALTDIQWWASLRADSPDNGMPIWPPATSRTLWCDASGQTGWGAQLRWDGRVLHSHGYWLSGTEANQHITWKELRTLRLSLQALLPEVQGQHVLLWEDNMPVVHIVLNGSSRSPELMTELRLLWAFLAKHDITLLPRYIRSQDNPADYWSRWQDRSAWQMLPSVFNALQLRRHGEAFTLDPFACRATALVQRYCSLRPDPGALARDGFSVSWRHELLWLNPPWELIPQVLFKLKVDRARGTLIVPHWPSQTWWPTLLSVTARCRMLPRPLSCIRPAHHGMVEPMLHPSLRLMAFEVDGSLDQLDGTVIMRGKTH